MSKSNIPELFIWVLYALVSGACLLFVAVGCSNVMGYGMVPGVIGAVLVALVLALLVGGLHKAAQIEGFRRLITDKKVVCVVLEGLLFVALLMGMIVLRAEFSWQIVGEQVYEAAFVTPEKFYAAEAHGGYRVYLYLMNLALLLFGNRTFAAVILQLLLLAGAAISLYFGVRRMAGPAAALLTVAFLGFAPYMITETCSLNPFLLFLLFYGLALNCIGGISYSMTQSHHLLDQIAAVLCYVASGAFIGFCCYLDVAGITLLVILTGVICFGDGMRLENDEEELKASEETSYKRRKLRVFESRIAEFLGNSAIVYVGIVIVALVVFWHMHGSMSSLLAQLALYTPDAFRVPLTIEAGNGLLEGVLLVVFMMFGVFSFWCSRRLGSRGVWLFSAILLASMQCFGMVSLQHMNGFSLLYLLCVILAGCGLADVAGEKLKKPVILAEEPMAIIDMDESEEPKQTLEPAINFIENPLPLPKKHTKKVMDYDYEVADDDDFDIP